MDKTRMDKAVIKYILLIASIVVLIVYYKNVFMILDKLWSVVYPLILGMIIAYILNIILKKVEKLYFPNAKDQRIIRTRRIAGIIISILLIFIVLVILVNLIVPELINAFIVIGREIPVYFEIARDWMLQYTEQIPSVEAWLTNLQIDWGKISENILALATSGVGGILNSTFSFVGIFVGGIANFVIALIFAIYILNSKEKLTDQTKRVAAVFIKPQHMIIIKKVLKTANETFSSFIVGQCTEAVILGVLCTLGMLLFRFPYAPMIGAFIGATALIPIVGAYLGAGIGAFMILTLDPLKALLFIIFVIVLQQVEGNLIYPRVVGASVGLPGIWVLAAVTIGGGLGGIIGMLLGVPITATAYKLLAIKVRLEENRQVRKKVKQIKK